MVWGVGGPRDTGGGGRKKETTVFNHDVAWLIARRQMPRLAVSRFETLESQNHHSFICSYIYFSFVF